MLRVVRGDERRSWGILAGRFRRRIDPHRLWKGFEAGRALHEALGRRCRGGQARLVPDLQDQRRAPVMDVAGCEIPQATVRMRVVVPPEEAVADRARILNRAEAVGKLGDDT